MSIRFMVPAMMTLRLILVMFVPPLTTRDAIDVTPAKRATTPKVLSRSPLPGKTRRGRMRFANVL